MFFIFFFETFTDTFILSLLWTYFRIKRFLDFKLKFKLWTLRIFTFNIDFPIMTFCNPLRDMKTQTMTSWVHLSTCFISCFEIRGKQIFQVIFEHSNTRISNRYWNLNQIVNLLCINSNNYCMFWQRKFYGIRK